MEDAVRVGIVDNDPYALDALGAMVTRLDPRFDVVWTTELGAVAISRCLSPARRPDVLVTDMSMADVPGTEVCRAIRVRTPDVGLVGVTSYSLEAFRDEAARCGAQALVSKTDLSGLAHAIRRAAEGRGVEPTGTMIGGGSMSDGRTSDVSAIRTAEPRPSTHAPFLDAADAHMLLEDASYSARGALSAKERDVLRLYAEGLSAKEIADRLGVGRPTVSTFERRALAKLGARSRAHAISICVRRHEI